MSLSRATALEGREQAMLFCDRADILAHRASHRKSPAVSSLVPLRRADRSQFSVEYHDRAMIAKLNVGNPDAR